jgi:hypothetical protein
MRRTVGRRTRSARSAGESGNLQYVSALSILNKNYAGYLQDDYKVSSKLTLNLGLRYEFETARTERFNRASREFCYTCTNPLQGKVPGLDLKGGLKFVGVDGQPRGIYDRDFNNFGPRVGAAYSLTDSMVVRAGFGLYYVPVVDTIEASSFSSATPWVTSLDGNITPNAVLSNPFPNGRVPETGSSLGLASLIGQSVRFVEPTDVNPVFYTWNVDVQRSLPSQSSIAVAYVGSRATHITQDNGPQNVNQVPSQYLSLGSALRATVTNPFLVNDVLKNFSAQVTASNFNLVLNIPADLPQILGDRNALELMFDNIVERDPLLKGRTSINNHGIPRRIIHLVGLEGSWDGNSF